MKPNWIQLNHLGIIQISGEGAKKLLQGQLTCDLELITEQQASLGALCNIKGRAISGFYLAQFADHYYLITPRDLVNKTLTTLKKYAVFFQAILTDVSDSWQLVGLLDQLPEAITSVFCASGRLKKYQGFYLNLTLQSPRYLLALAPETELTDFAPLQKDQPWQAQDIQDHLTLLNEKTSEMFIPLELGYEKFNGISFKKGCYTGQEIIARVHYRGKLKQHLRCVQSPKLEESMDWPLCTIYNKDHEPAGQFIESIEQDGQRIGLALIREDQEANPLWIEASPIPLVILNNPI